MAEQISRDWDYDTLKKWGEYLAKLDCQGQGADYYEQCAGCYEQDVDYDEQCANRLNQIHIKEQVEREIPTKYVHPIIQQAVSKHKHAHKPRYFILKDESMVCQLDRRRDQYYSIYVDDDEKIELIQIEEFVEE